MSIFFGNEAEKARRAASESSAGKRSRKSRSNSASKTSPKRGRSASRAPGGKSTDIIPITKSLSPESKKKGRSLAAQIGKLKKALEVQGDTMKVTEAAIAPGSKPGRNSSKETVSQRQALEAIRRSIDKRKKDAAAAAQPVDYNRLRGRG